MADRTSIIFIFPISDIPLFAEFGGSLIPAEHYS